MTEQEMTAELRRLIDAAVERAYRGEGAGCTNALLPGEPRATLTLGDVLSRFEPFGSPYRGRLFEPSFRTPDLRDRTESTRCEPRPAKSGNPPRWVLPALWWAAIPPS